MKHTVKKKVKVSRPAAKKSATVRNAKPKVVAGRTSKKLVRKSKPAARTIPAIPPILFEGDPVPVSPATVAPAPPQTGEEPKEASLQVERHEPTVLDGPVAIRPNDPMSTSSSGAVTDESLIDFADVRIHLIARDTHWLYAHWNLTETQMHCIESQAKDGIVVLKVFADSVDGPLLDAILLPPGVSFWFLPVPHAGKSYAVQLGYYDLQSRWIWISSSEPVMTPPDSVMPLPQTRAVLTADFAEETAPPGRVEESTVPASGTGATNGSAYDSTVDLIQRALTERLPAHEVLEQLRATGFDVSVRMHEFAPASGEASEQERRLDEIILQEFYQNVGVASAEWSQRIREEGGEAKTGRPGGSYTASPFENPVFHSTIAPVSSLESVSIPNSQAASEALRAFWMNVNAEVVIYGSTAPDAMMEIAGRTVKLRKDGSFSIRFALPDGQFQLNVEAVSADGVESRNAKINFGRSTKYRGEVGRHPQDPALPQP